MYIIYEMYILYIERGNYPMRENLQTSKNLNTAIVQKQLHKRGISQKELTATRTAYLKEFLKNFTGIQSYNELEVAFIVNVDERFKKSGLSISDYIAKYGENICEETIVDMYLTRYKGYTLASVGRQNFVNYSRVCFGKNFSSTLKQSVEKYKNLLEFFLVYDSVIVLNIIRKRERDRVKYQEITDLENLYNAVEKELNKRSYSIDTKTLSTSVDTKTLIVEHLMYDVDATPPQRLEASPATVAKLTSNLIAQLPKALLATPSNSSSKDTTSKKESSSPTTPVKDPSPKPQVKSEKITTQVESKSSDVINNPTATQPEKITTQVESKSSDVINNPTRKTSTDSKNLL